MLRLYRLAFLFLLFLSPLAVAQVAPVAPPQQQQGEDDEDRPEPTQPPVAVPPPSPAAARTPTKVVPGARTPSGPSPSAPSTAPDMVRLQFPNSDVDDVLRLYEQLTGKKLVRDNFVQGKVNIFISKDVPREEAIKIIEINLLMNGFSLIPADDDIIKVIGTGKNPRTTGVPIISDPAQIPAGDHVVSFLFKLRYADPQELQQVLGQYLSPPQTYTSFLALPKSSSLLITENSSVIRVISRIIDQVDIPPAEVVSEFIPLLRADASKVVDMLKDVFEKGTQPTQPGVPGQPIQPGVRNVRQPNLPVQPVNIEGDIGSLTALTEDSIVVGKIKLAADVRTNRIHVITRPVNMTFVRKLISEFDANVEFAKPVTRALRYISAGDVLPVLVQSLTEPGTQQGGGPEVPGGGANPANPQQNLNRNRGTGNTSTGLSGSSSGGGDSSQNFSEELSTQAVDTTPKAVTIGNAKIIADQRANSIIVLGNREVVVKVGKILDEMDVKAPQVALSTVIGELRLQNNEDFGVDFFTRSTNKPGVSGAGTTNFTGIPPFAGGSTLIPGSSPPAFTGGNVFDPSNLLSFTQLATKAASGANVYLAAGNSLAAVVHALQVTGRFRTISRPTVFTSNNKKAIIASGTEIPVPVSSVFQPVGTGTINGGLGQQSNIQFKKVALQLEVVPLINSEKEVTLDILQKVDNVDGFTPVNNNNIPNIATRYIKTTVSAPNCATIVLGGLILDTNTRMQTGVPILSKIPLIGGLFRETSKVKDRRELIILMRPEVALTKLDLYRLRQRSSDKTHFGPELEEDDCPDCPKSAGEDKQLPPPDRPAAKDL